MSLIRQCDRCGAESEEGLTMRWWKMSVPTVDPEDFDPEDFDICPECRDGLSSLVRANDTRWATITRGDLEAWRRAGKS